MFKLFHSKLFRQNLFKWVFMYVAIIGLLTSVITYSKFISNFSPKDQEARSAKFKVDITPMMETCQDIEGKNVCSLVVATSDYCYQPTTTDPSVTYENKSYKCPITSYRPTKPVEFFFKIDLSEMEVSSDVFIRTELGNKNLSIDKIYSLTSPSDTSVLTLVPGPSIHDGTEEILHIDNPKDSEGKEYLTGDALAEALKNKTTMHIGVDIANENRQTVYYFKVTANYNITEDDKDKDDIVFNNESKSGTIDIGFSAIQRDKK